MNICMIMCGSGVETKSIVEKGLWDAFFSLKGGGLVHMKLQFVLNEEERIRIRLMVLFRGSDLFLMININLYSKLLLLLAFTTSSELACRENLH